VFKKIFIVVISIIILFSTSVQGTGGGGNNPPWGGPSFPWCEFCYNDSSDWWQWEGYNDYFSNSTPDTFESDVEITGKGIQTCINLTLPAGCVADVTFQWLNASLYFDIWMDWVNEQDWGWEDWDVNWSTEPTWENDSFWFNYSNWSLLSHSQQLCAYNINWTCRTENDWASVWDSWRIIANITCGVTTYNITCYYCFQPELCPLSYIWPPSPNGTACPCCSPMCINISNEHGHPMNITIYRNDTLDENFYQVNKYLYISNGTYCFCIDGHINNSIYYPMQYDTVYHWYVNITDTVTGTISNSSIFRFRTEPDPDDCFCGNLTEAYHNVSCGCGSSLGMIGTIGVLGLIGWFMVRKRLVVKKGKK